MPAALRLLILAFSLSTASLLAQAGDRPPVILVNGFDVDAAVTGTCELEESSAQTFGRLEQLLIADGAEVFFFDNCRFGAPPIEALGEELGRLIAGLTDAAGDPIEQVDLVGFSMGSLIIRSYLNGKREPAETFDPPEAPRARKVVLVGGPHFGSPLADLSGSDQGRELRRASRFSWDLARWNQGFDDLRNVDALAIVGSGGRGRRGDGVVGIHSASLLSFWNQPADRTRVLFACHNALARLLCDTGDALMPVEDDSHPVGRAIRAFLAGTDEWRSIGTPIDEHPATLGLTDIYVAARGSNDDLLTDLSRVEAVALDGSADVLLELRPSGIAAARDIPAGRYRIVVERDEQRMETEVELAPNRTNTVLVKFGPRIARVQPAAAPVATLLLAPGSLISIFGERLAESAAAFTALPLPVELGGVRVLVDGEPLGLLFAGANQINALTPASIPGYARLRVETGAGAHGWPVVIARGVPAIFTLDNTGAGAAAALDAVTFAPIDDASPVAAGGLVAVFLTGLDPVGPVEVLLDGAAQTVRFADAAPGFVGLDQINFQVGLATTPGPRTLVVKQAGRRSNETTLAVD